MAIKTVLLKKYKTFGQHRFVGTYSLSLILFQVFLKKRFNFVERDNIHPVV